MNEVIRQIKDRKSIRAYTEQPITQDTKNEIIGAALEAPTAGSMMLYSILDITDLALKEQLSVLCDNQPFIAKAPLVLVFLADYQRWYDAYEGAGCEPRKPGEGDLLLACADAIIAAQNTVVAAESYGIGSCYIGDIIENYEAVRELLKLPEYAVPAAMLVYGYPLEAQQKRKKNLRFDRQYIVHENGYNRLSMDEQLQMHQSKNTSAGYPEKDVMKEIQAKCQQKYHSDFALEMNRSAKEYMKKFNGNS